MIHRFFSKKAFFLFFGGFILSNVNAQIQKLSLPKHATQYKNVVASEAHFLHLRENSRTCGFSLIPKEMFERMPNDNDGGEVRQVVAFDFSNSPPEPTDVTARLSFVSNFLQYYTDTTQTFPEKEVSLITEEVYPTLSDLLQVDRKLESELFPLNVLLTTVDTPDAQTGDLAGYFIPPANAEAKGWLVIDAAHLQRFGARAAVAVFAHQLTHVVQWYHDPDEEPWIVEGMCDFAAWSVGERYPNDPALFLRQPDVSLSRWENQPEDYARAFLWIAYLYEHYGGWDLLRSIIRNPANGLDAILETLNNVNKTGQDLTLKKIFGDWLVANYLDNPEFAGEVYGYRSFDLPQVHLQQTFGFLPCLRKTRQCERLAGDYYAFTGGEGLVLRLEAREQTGSFAARAILMRKNAAISVKDFPFNLDHSGILPILDFGVNCEKVVFIPYNVELDPGRSRVEYEFSAEGSGGPAVFLDTLCYYDDRTPTALLLALPSQQINGDYIQSQAVRYTTPSRGRLIRAQIALSGRIDSDSRLRVLIRSSSDSTMAGTPLHTVELPLNDIRRETISWLTVDFRGLGLSLESGEDLLMSWQFVQESPADTLFALLDTTSTAEGRSYVLLQEAQEWRLLEENMNFFANMVMSIPAEETPPELQTRLRYNATGEGVEVILSSNQALDPLSVNGMCSLNDMTHRMDFTAVKDSSNGFVSETLRLSSDGIGRIVVSARRSFGTTIATDTVTFSTQFIPPDSGGRTVSANQQIELNVLPNSIEQPTHFVMFESQRTRRNRPKTEDRFVTFEEFTIGPSGLRFDESAELTFRYDNLPDALLAENNLAIAFHQNGEWMILGGELYREQKVIRLLINETGRYRLISRAVDQSEDDPAVPDAFYLRQNYPNPFNPVTTITFGIPEQSHTLLRVVNLKGQVIATLLDQRLDAGEHRIEWDSTDENHVPVASGVYLYQLKAGEFVETKKLVLVR